jgi:hypothetical protein
MLSPLPAPGVGRLPPAEALTSVAGLLVSQLASRAKVRVLLHSSQRGVFM